MRRGLDVEWVDDPEQADVAMVKESKRAALDISRLQADTQFTPRFDIEQGLADYLDLD
jgi:nucleoside-diphosphate-sugar epimerase